MLSFVLGLMLMVLPAVAAAQTPVRGGTVVQAIAADPPTMNPGTTTDTQAWTLMGKLFNGLTHLDNDYRSHPDLAERSRPGSEPCASSSRELSGSSSTAARSSGAARA
jgi:ABC-type transport system substrate-binding protein